ncbi:antA/AntB antirepressor family protein [Rhizobium sp. X9]|uniref:antA/AntB antirepressor family protein n=1 Tax=Rhizobium sp. X9 TaxID=2815360 RepID=UPI001C0BC74D|nr:antA/AntB antirepressor family protein [Rhizobium sp. X9]
MNAQNQFPAISDKAISGQIVKTVDGREVHRFLEAKKDYTTWIKDRIKKYGFVENVDYLLTEIGEQHPTGMKYRTEYYLTIGMGKELGMVDRSAKGREIRKYFLSIEERSFAPHQPMTAAEIVLQNAQALVTFERRQAEVERLQAETASALEAVNARVTVIEDTAPLKAKPQHCETKTEIKTRMNKLYGLPAWLVDEVLTSISYRPPAFAMVKNSHENAQGSSFAVYQIIDITKLFKRFISECTQATATTATHPSINGRFKILRRE